MGEQNILENLGGIQFLKVHSWATIFVADILPQKCASILWHNRTKGVVQNLFRHSRGATNIFYTFEGGHENIYHRGTFQPIPCRNF